MEQTGGFYVPPRPGTPLAASAGAPAAPPAAADAPPPPTNDTSAPAPPADGATSDQPATLPDPVPVQMPTLDQELAGVMKGLGSFWGKVRKQSVAAYHQAEKQVDQYGKDLTPLVSKARANFDHLSEQTKAEINRLSEASATSPGDVIIGVDGIPIMVETVSSPKSEDAPKVDKGKGVDRSGADEPAGTEGEGDANATETASEVPTQNPAAAAAAFFTKMQTQLAANPNVEGLRKDLQKQLNQVQSNLSTLPASFQTNLNQLQTQIQHIDTKAAENYLSKGEHWLAEIGGDLSKMAKDAIRVVPPSGDKSRKREERLRKAEQVAVGRKDTLLFGLRTTPSLFLIDPAQPPSAPTGDDSVPQGDTREAFSKFLQGIEDRGGLDGESFRAQISEEKDANLAKTFAELVPAKLTPEAFWSRYFFRRSLIEEDERRRREVLEGAAAADDEDDFSWDMEEEDDEEEPAPATTSSLPSKSTTPVPTTLPTDASSPTTPVPPTSSEPRSHSPNRESSPSSDKEEKKSPRASSDGASSYDVVGVTSGAPSEGEPEVETVTKVAAKVDSDEDSDWE